jgi:RNA polymerase sigma-70 factor (ECF subfamily)
MCTQNQLLFSDSSINWNHYTLFIRKVARKFLGVKFKDWVEDAAQEALVKIFVNKDKFTTKIATPEAWFYTITKNICLDLMSKKGNDPFNKIDVNESLTIFSFDVFIFEIDENTQLIEKAMEKLSERDRLLLTLKYYQDQSGREIALALNVPEKNIPSFMMRAKARLKQELEKGEYRLAA